jgi:hypothetical protein
VFDIGCAEDITHMIWLKTDEPVFIKQFPLSPKKTEIVKEHV